MFYVQEFEIMCVSGLCSLNIISCFLSSNMKIITVLL